MNRKTHKNSLFETILFISLMIFFAIILIGNFVYGTNTARICIGILVGIILWFILGCAVLAGIDKNNELFEWVWDKAPNGCFSTAAIFFFPVVAIMYVYRRKKIE